MFVESYTLKDLTLCDDVIDFFDNATDLHYSGEVGKDIVDKTHKDCLQCNLDSNEKLFKEYTSQLINITHEYCEKYNFVNHYAPWGIIEPINIKKYTPPHQAFHGWHTERAAPIMPICLRNLVFMTYLNDVDDGGETEYFYQDLKISPKKGKTVIWPADWTHTHRGLPSLTQTKYIITGWFSFLPDER